MLTNGIVDTLYKESKQGRTSKANYACCDKSTNEEQQLVRLAAAAVSVSCVCNPGKDSQQLYQVATPNNCVSHVKQLCQLTKELSMASNMK